VDLQSKQYVFDRNCDQDGGKGWSQRYDHAESISLNDHVNYAAAKKRWGKQENEQAWVGACL
jgi:hypothetical protein